MDRGANGGLCGTDVRIIEKTGRLVDIQDIYNHQITDVPIVTAGDVVHTQKGPVIIIIHQYEYIGHRKPSTNLDNLKASIAMSMTNL